MAQEIEADYVVLDDLLARRKAHYLAVDVIGTVGLLLFTGKAEITECGANLAKDAATYRATWYVFSASAATANKNPAVGWIIKSR